MQQQNIVSPLVTIVTSNAEYVAFHAELEVLDYTLDNHAPKLDVPTIRWLVSSTVCHAFVRVAIVL